jgi:hypothetical protein
LTKFNDLLRAGVKAKKALPFLTFRAFEGQGSVLKRKLMYFTYFFKITHDIFDALLCDKTTVELRDEAMTLLTTSLVSFLPLGVTIDSSLACILQALLCEFPQVL